MTNKNKANPNWLQEMIAKNVEAQRMRMHDRLYWPDLDAKTVNKSTRPKDQDLNMRAAILARLGRK